jgi:uncharacterized protein YkwD
LAPIVVEMYAIAFSSPSRRAIRPLVVVLLAFVSLAASNAQAAAKHADRLLAPPAACAAPVDTSTGAQLGAMSCLVNYARVHAGVPALRESKTLDLAGTLKLNADLRCGSFSHTPCGQPFQSVFTAAGYSLGSAYSVGENLAYGEGALGTPQAIMQAWLASPDHRENLLSTSWTSFGLALRAGATFLGASGVALWANEFAGP